MSSSCEDEDCRGLLKWLEGKVGHRISYSLYIGKSSNRGRGLYASKNIQRGDRIAKLPFSARLSPDNLPGDISSLMGDTITDEAKLAVLIMIEKRRGEYSDWKTYMDCLPLPQDMHSSIFWTDDELKMIRLSFVCDETRKLKDKIKQQFLRILRAVPDLFGYSTSLEVIEQQFTYSYALVISRARKSVNGVLYLTPFLDFLNHDTSSMDVVESDAYQRYTEVTVARDYAKGDEILINYGNLPTSGFLLFLGFTFPNNDHDFVLFSVSLDQQDKLFARKSVILQQQRVDKDDRSISWDSFWVTQVEIDSKHGEGIPLLLRAFARVRVCGSEEDLEELEEAAAIDGQGQVGSHPLKKLEKEIEAHEHLLHEINGLIVKYNEVVKTSEVCEVDIRRRLAKDLLQAEVRILNSVGDWLKCYISKLEEDLRMQDL